jgi:hypothetical protein
MQCEHITLSADPHTVSERIMRVRQRIWAGRARDTPGLPRTYVCTDTQKWKIEVLTTMLTHVLYLHLECSTNHVMQINDLQAKA